MMHVIVSSFNEHPFIDYRFKEPEKFDISATDYQCQPDFIKNSKFDLEAYCVCLVNKLLTLSREELKPFIEYQCSKVNDASHWVNKLELLIELNHPIFIADFCRYAKLQAVIETVREKVQHCRHLHYETEFDFQKLKKQLDSMYTYAEKHKLLLENLTSLKQSNILNHSELNDKHIKLLELEISKLIDLQPLEGQIKGQIENLTYSGSKNKIKLNGHINVIVDVFYQAMRELRVEGKPYIDASIKDVAELICNSFVDINGNEIGNATVQTMLSPKKSDKRPKGENRFILAND